MTMTQVCLPCGSVIDLCSIKPPEDPPDTLVPPSVVYNVKQKHHEIWSFYQETCVNNGSTPSTLAQSTETPTTPTGQSSTTTESYGTSTFFNISSFFPPVGGEQGVSSAASVLLPVLVSLFALALCIIIIIVLCIKFKPDLLRKMRLPFQRKRSYDVNGISQDRKNSTKNHIYNDRGHDVCDPTEYGDESENGPKSPGAESVCSTSPLQEHTENHDNFIHDVEKGDNSGFVDIMINGETDFVNPQSSSVFFSNQVHVDNKDETIHTNIDNDKPHTTVDDSPYDYPVKRVDTNGTEDIRLEMCSTSESVTTGGESKSNELDSDMSQDQQNQALEPDLVPEGSVENSKVKSEEMNKTLQPEAIDLVVPDDSNTQNNVIINNKLSHLTGDTENMTLNVDHNGDIGSKSCNHTDTDDNGNSNNILDNLAPEKNDFDTNKMKLELPDGSEDKFADFPVKSFPDSGYASRQISRQEST